MALRQPVPVRDALHEGNNVLEAAVVAVMDNKGNSSVSLRAAEPFNQDSKHFRQIPSKFHRTNGTNHDTYEHIFDDLCKKIIGPHDLPNTLLAMLPCPLTRIASQEDGCPLMVVTNLLLHFTRGLVMTHP